MPQKSRPHLDDVAKPCPPRKFRSHLNDVSKLRSPRKFVASDIHHLEIVDRPGSFARISTTSLNFDRLEDLRRVICPRPFLPIRFSNSREPQFSYKYCIYNLPLIHPSDPLAARCVATETVIAENKKATLAAPFSATMNQ